MRAAVREMRAAGLSWQQIAGEILMAISVFAIPLSLAYLPELLGKVGLL